MEPLQAINTLSQVVKTAKLPYNEHVLLERSVDILTNKIQSPNQETQSEIISDITFDDTEVVEVTEEKPKARARAKKGNK